MRYTHFFTYVLSLTLLSPLFISCHAQKNGDLPLENPIELKNESLEQETDGVEHIVDDAESPFSSEADESFDVQPQDVWDVSDVDVSKIHPTNKLIAFSFDDSPSRTLENILAVYAAYNEANPDCPASATIFCNSKLFDAQTPHLLHGCLALGMELGNHTHSHYDLTTISEPILRDEIDRTDKALQKIDGKARHLLRAPFGKTNDLVKTLAPVPLIDWTIDTLDWSGVSEDAIYRAVFDNRFSGAIVLMHDGYANTISALKRLLPDLKADGYQVVSVSQLAKMHGCTFRRGNTYIRARKCN